MRENRIKTQLQQGQPVFGVSIMIPSPQVVEMVARLGFDWVLLDCEHGTVSTESLEVMTMAAEAAGITPIGRPRSADPAAILEVLERGVQGVQVPHVRSAAEAREVVQAVRYHPAGQRGLAARTRPAGYGIGITLDEYARQANEQLLVCVQVEDADALEQLGAILEVDGVDVVFIGPSDLSQSLGRPGRTGDPVVRQAMRSAFRAVTRRGLAAGSAGDAASCREYRRHGVAYLYTHLPALLAAGAGSFMREVTRPRPGRRAQAQAAS
jgi:4-hydroxy-2-oxoheptanedioate aldolase